MEKSKDIFSVKTYYYDLPEEIIAQTPAQPRDSSKLLVFHRENSKIEDKIFTDVIDYLKKDDVLVINTTKVLPARLYGEKVSTTAKVEVLLLKRVDLTTWEVLLKPAKRFPVGTEIIFHDNNKKVILSAVVKDDLSLAGGKLLQFKYDGVFEDILNEIGVMPLPPYIKNQYPDKSRYQTVYSKETGSSAAPTAGLHFTPELLQKVKDKGIIVAEVLLHVGLGTFRPVSDENILQHHMHSEYYEITPETADVINQAKAKGNKVIAVGTTSVRTLETSSNKSGNILAGKGNTDIFIYPGYKFKVVDAIITNFHLPESTLIMLVSAFCGIDETLNMYNYAIQKKYRFFSFGDASLII